MTHRPGNNGAAERGRRSARPWPPDHDRRRPPRAAPTRGRRRSRSGPEPPPRAARRRQTGARGQKRARREAGGGAAGPAPRARRRRGGARQRRSPPTRGAARRAALLRERREPSASPRRPSPPPPPPLRPPAALPPARPAAPLPPRGPRPGRRPSAPGARPPLPPRAAPSQLLRPRRYLLPPRAPRSGPGRRTGRGGWEATSRALPPRWKELVGFPQADIFLLTEPQHHVRGSGSVSLRAERRRRLNPCRAGRPRAGRREGGSAAHSPGSGGGRGGSEPGLVLGPCVAQPLTARNTKHCGVTPPGAPHPAPQSGVGSSAHVLKYLQYVLIRCRPSSAASTGDRCAPSPCPAAKFASLPRLPAARRQRPLHTTRLRVPQSPRVAPAGIAPLPAAPRCWQRTAAGDLHNGNEKGPLKPRENLEHLRGVSAGQRR